MSSGASRLSGRRRWIAVIALLLAAGAAWWAWRPATPASAGQTTADSSQPDGRITAPDGEGIQIVDENTPAHRTTDDATPAPAQQPEAAAGPETAATPKLGELTMDSANASADEEEERRLPRHWHPCAAGAMSGSEGYRFDSDPRVVSHGGRSASIGSAIPSPSPAVAGYCQKISASEYRGRRVAYSAYLRTVKALPGAQIVIRADAANGRVLAFADQRNHLVPGTTPWSQQTIVIDIPADTSTLMVGALLMNTGTFWIDEVNLEVVDESWPLTQTIGRAGAYGPPAYAAYLSTRIQNADFEETVAAQQREP